MTLFDGIILGITLLSSLMGLMRGLTREVLGLASWIGGASLTLIGMPYVQIIARKYIQNGMMADIAAAGGLFILFLILFSLISHTLSGFIRDSVLSGIDRSLGILFGIGRGVVILCFFQILVSCFVPRHKQPLDFQRNRFAPMIYNGSDFIISILPQNIGLKIFEQQQKVFNDTVQQTMQLATSDKMGISTPGEIARALGNAASTQLEAENLARLRPKTITTEEAGHVTEKQQNDLNRFLNLETVDEDGAREAENNDSMPSQPQPIPPTMTPQQLPLNQTATTQKSITAPASDIQLKNNPIVTRPIQNRN